MLEPYVRKLCPGREPQGPKRVRGSYQRGFSAAVSVIADRQRHGVDSKYLPQVRQRTLGCNRSSGLSAVQQVLDKDSVGVRVVDNERPEHAQVSGLLISAFSARIASK